MAEILSQQEIDQLLGKIQTGGEKGAEYEPEKEAMLYDFRLPNRISKNQLRTIKSLHENFSEGLSSFLMTKLQSIVNINITSVDQIYYSEYILSVSNPACLFTFDIKNTDIKGVLELSPELALILVDRLLGGNGKGTKTSKVITPIEQKVLYIFVERVMQELKKAWMQIDNYNFIIGSFESDIDFVQITSQSDSVLIITCEINIGETKSLLNLCYATYAFDSVLSKLATQSFNTTRTSKFSGNTAKALIVDNLKKAEIYVNVEFTTASISLKNLMSLEKGDVILTNGKTGDEVTVKVDNKPLFYGIPGVVNGHKAVKVTSRAVKKIK
ncbi:MAG TPA: flagellar motor switch protein FliM [Ignavibacteriaceae bacterium]|jgi:flagellar motor switch protein FliM|nr:flagellar motor switch protein FliM [Ignavibacteriaceae bacterium]